MFNSTIFSTEEGSILGSGHLMLIIGTLATTMSGFVINLVRSITGYVYNMLFSSIYLDDGKDDSPISGVTEGLYRHIIKNRTRFQGWNVRLAKKDFGHDEGEIEDHHFDLPSGSVLFWSWSKGSWFPHLYYAYFERGKGWWQTSSMTLIFLRISSGDAIRMLDSFSKDKGDGLVNHVWGYPDRDNDPKWFPDKGRDRKIDKPVYIPTPDTEAVLERIKLSAESWNIENKSVAAFNAGRFLFYGPHGTYKTTLVRHIAHLYGMNIYTVTQNELGVNSLRKMVATLPDRSILLFDDIDLTILDAPQPETITIERHERKGIDLKPVMKSVFGGTTKFPPQSFIFMTTNSEKLPKAITSRFIPFYLGHAPPKWNREIFLHMCPGADEQADKFMTDMGETKISQRIITESLAVSYASSKCDPQETLDSALKLILPPPVVEEEKKEEEHIPVPLPLSDCFMGI